MRLSWRKGVAGRHPRIGSGLSGQASAFYRCSSYTPRLRTFFIVQDASWQARGWAGLRAARFGERGSVCARSSPRRGAAGAARSAFVLPSLAAAWAPMPERGCRFHMRRSRAVGGADEQLSLRWCGWRENELAEAASLLPAWWGATPSWFAKRPSFTAGPSGLRSQQPK